MPFPGKKLSSNGEIVDSLKEFGERIEVAIEAREILNLKGLDKVDF